MGSPETSGLKSWASIHPRRLDGCRRLVSVAGYCFWFAAAASRAYKSARYTVNRGGGSVLDFCGGTLLCADDEATFRQTVDRIQQTMQQGKTSTFDLKHMEGEFDLTAIVKPRKKGWECSELPSDRAEIGMDIVSADERKGDSVWLCRSGGKPTCWRRR